MTDLPTGTVTFLFTDVEGSTRLWEEHPDAMKTALARHDEILRTAVGSHQGHVVKTTGDGIHAAFVTAHDAVMAAIDAQKTLSSEPWDQTGPLRVRMGIHTGEAEHREGDYYGTAVNRAARLMAAAHGGQVLVSHASEELLDDGLAHDVHLSDLGEHRLRDLSRAERIFQVSAPGLDSPFIAPRSLDAYPGNLPVQLTSFVGRDAELTKLSQALENARLVTLTGVGGVGKTRLATQLAAEVVPRFSDGAWLCELAAADDADALAEVLAATLNVRPRPGLKLDDSIIEFLRAKELLLVLDNCEHLLDAAGRLADAILRNCPSVRIVATSREGLAVEGEHVVPLRSLTVPSQKPATGDLVESEAMRLFVDRAGAARGGFVADERNATVIADICRRLDGIPLAIELAAARVTAMSPSDIATRLDERFRLLTGGRRAAVERHQTLRATVDWSYSLLEDLERTVFDRLGVFVGGFDSRAAEAVVSGAEIEAWDVVDAISGLVSKSMVIADEAGDGGIRYQLLETLRHYARERLDESGAADDWRRRHAEHFALIAEELGPQITGPDELPAKRRLMGDLDNFRAAVTWGLDRTEQSDSELAVRIIAALARFGTNVRWTGISGWAHEALDHADRTTPGRRTDLLGLAAMHAFYGGSMRESEQLAAAAIRDGLGADCSAATLPYIALANIAANRGDIGTAHRLVEDALRAFDDSGLHDDWHHVLMVTCDAMWSVMAGELDRARERMAVVMPTVRRLGNPSALTFALYALGSASWRDEPDLGLASLVESVVLTQSGASEAALGPCLSQIARIRARRGEGGLALRRLREALAHCHEVADRVEFAGVLLNGAEVLSLLEHHDVVATVHGFLSEGPLVDFTPRFGGPESDEQQRAFAQAQEVLGAERHAPAYARGAAMSYEAIAEYVLTTLDRLIAA